MSEILSIGELLDLGGSASTAGLIPYSALEYSAQKITGISGTAIGGQGGTDSATVSAIASAYAESAASGKLDNSASGTWYPLTGNPSGFLTGVDLTPYAYESSVSSKVDQSAFDNCCSSMSSVVSSLETSVTSMSSVVSGLTGDYAYNSSLSAYQPKSSISAWTGDMSSISSKLDQSAFTAYTATAHPHVYTGVSPMVVDNTADTISLSATSVQLDSSMTAYTSGGSGFIGVNADFNAFVHTADMSGYIPTGESSKYQLTANMTGYIPTSESSKYYSTGNPSSFATTAQLNSGLSGKLDSTAQVVTSTAGSSDYVNKINGSAISARTAEDANRAVSAYVRGSSIQMSTIYDGVVDMQSSKLDVSSQVVSSISTGSAGVLREYVDRINGMYLSANSSYYAQSSYLADKARSAIVDADHDPVVVVPMSAFAIASACYSTSNPSGFIDSASLGFDGSGNISSIDGSAIAGASLVPYTSPSGTIAVDNVNNTLESWNSSLRVDEHVTAASSIPGTASWNIYTGNPSDNLWKGTANEGDTVIFSACNGSNYNLTVSGFGYMVGGGSALVATFNLPANTAGVTAQALINTQYSAFRMSWAGTGYTPYPNEYNGLSGYVMVERPAQTASSTSVYENVLKDSMWNSLTAWATSQGWTP